MIPRYQLLEAVPFMEFTSVTVTDVFNPLFDVEKIQGENLQTYCQSLVDKIFQLKYSEIPYFIAHHCSITKNPMQWLNKFEKLILANEKLFHNGKNRFMKCKTGIDLKRKMLKTEESRKGLLRPNKKQTNAECEDRYFSFKELRNQLNMMSVFEEKIMLLTNEKYNYQLANIDFVNRNLPDFDGQCDKEIERLYEVKKLQEELKKKAYNGFRNQISGNKIRIHCNLNQFVDLFFQLNRELFIKGKPFLDGNTNDFVSLICNNFTDKEGREISSDSVRTILRPSKIEKRPKIHKRIDLDKLF